MSVTLERLSENQKSAGPSEGRGVPSPIPGDILSRLGIDPDEVLAAEAGVSTGCIARHRQMRGILRQKRLPLGDNKYAHLLGTAPDGEVAASLGMNRHAVSVARRKRGIPLVPAKRGRRAVAPPPVATAAETE